MAAVVAVRWPWHRSTTRRALLPHAHTHTSRTALAHRHPGSSNPGRHTAGPSLKMGGWLRSSVHRPHVHRDGPVGFDDFVPDLGQNDFAIGTKEVVVPSLYMRPNDVDMQEGLFDEFFHALETCQSRINQWIG